MNRWISGFLVLLSTSAVVLTGCGPSAGQTGGSGTAKTRKVADDLSAPLLRPEDAAKVDPNFKPSPPKPIEIKATEVTMGMSQRMSSGMLAKNVGGKRIFILGTVSAVSAENNENMSITLTGFKTLQGKQLLLRCKLAATERDTVNKVKVDDEVRVEGIMDGDLKDDVLEFKDCVLASKAPDAKEADAEKK